MRPNTIARFFCPLLAMAAFAASWRPVDPAELALKQPKIQADADAEAIFWEVAIEDRMQSGEVSVTFQNLDGTTGKSALRKLCGTFHE